MSRIDRLLDRLASVPVRNGAAMLLALGCGAALAAASRTAWPWQAALLVPLTLLARAAVDAAQVRYAAWRAARAGAALAAAPAPAALAATELAAAGPYLDLMRQQLSGSLAETEQGIMGVIEALTAIHGMSQRQQERISASEDNGAELAAVVAEKIMVDEQMVSILELFVTRQEQDIEGALSRVARLQEVKSLGPMIDVITDVAQQTNLMSINAAILAAHAGEEGRAFAVLAQEIRGLSQRTAHTSREIANTIRSATHGLEQEMLAVNKVGERQSAIGNMRKVVDDIRAMQSRFGNASQRMLAILEWDKLGHAELVSHLASAMGNIQVHDILRQRVDHVGAALLELHQHLDLLAAGLERPGLVQQVQPSLQERLDAHTRGYVMQSQRALHEQVLGGEAPAQSERPAIELF